MKRPQKTGNTKNILIHQNFNRILTFDLGGGDPIAFNKNPTAFNKNPTAFNEVPTPLRLMKLATPLRLRIFVKRIL